MGLYCKLKRKCSICLKEKRNIDFYGNKERTKLYSYCKTCRYVKDSLREGLIDIEQVAGFDYDWTKLKPDSTNLVKLIEDNSKYSLIPYELAERYVKQVGAYVVDENTIYELNSHFFGEIEPRSFVRSKFEHCFYCEKPLYTNNKKTIDHKIPIARGGLDTIANLVVSCSDCNNKKSSLSAKTFLKKLKENDVVHCTQKVYRKKCSICDEVILKKEYDKVYKTCSHCLPFYHLYQRNVISKEQIKQNKKLETTEFPVIVYLEENYYICGQKNFESLFQNGLLIRKNDKDVFFLSIDLNFFQNYNIPLTKERVDFLIKNKSKKYSSIELAKIKLNELREDKKSAKPHYNKMKLQVEKLKRMNQSFGRLSILYIQKTGDTNSRRPIGFVRPKVIKNLIDNKIVGKKKKTFYYNSSKDLKDFLFRYFFPLKNTLHNGEKISKERVESIVDSFIKSEREFFIKTHDIKHIITI